jgi:Holliday junction resolvase RusA-like endonuclease
MDGGPFRGNGVRIEIPGPPMGVGRAKTRIVTAASGRSFATIYTPKKTRDESAVIRDYAAQAMGEREPFTGAVELRMSLYFPIPSGFTKKKRTAIEAGTLRPTVKPDWDNAGKFTDALSKVVWLDDKQVTDAHIWKRYSSRPRVIIEVRPLQEE